ncbi:hypothetical protein IQ238_25410 [Pleurocapsales cyanobacterium LEGE 06147]|nr:hypothetical protein [Pleurocapsales cyanobacterium LEGE 06147]
MWQISSYSLIPIAIVVVAIPLMPMLAQNNRFSHLNLALGFDRATAIVMGYTGGSYSLSSIVNQDRHGNPCIGYGDPEPDHSMVLENDFPRLTIQIDSGGKDTTLIVRGPERQNIRCGFAHNESRDAVVDDINWQAGTYEIWVGSMKPNQNSPYRLSVRQ